MSIGTDRDWLLRAVEHSRRCPPSGAAYSVGAMVVSGDGVLLAEGHSRESDPYVHAEESALAKLAHQAPAADLRGATVYSSLEPCSTRRSRPRSCTGLIIAAGISRVVYALREPPLFAQCHGDEQLRAAGLQVVEDTALAPLVREINAHVLDPAGGGDQPGSRRR